MAQNEDSSAAQAHCNMRVVTTMKRAELTQKMIDMKMSMWEDMGIGRQRRKPMNQSKTCLVNKRIFRLNFWMLEWRRECLIQSF